MRSWLVWFVTRYQTKWPANGDRPIFPKNILLIWYLDTLTIVPRSKIYSCLLALTPVDIVDWYHVYFNSPEIKRPFCQTNCLVRHTCLTKLRLARRSWLVCLLSVFSQKSITYREETQNKWSRHFGCLLLAPKIWTPRAPSAMVWFVGFVLRACHCFRQAGNSCFGACASLFFWGRLALKKVAWTFW